MPDTPTEAKPTILTLTREKMSLDAAIAQEEADHKRRLQALTTQRSSVVALLAVANNGLDLDRVRLAETFMSAGVFKRGGSDREAARQMAIAWFAGAETKNGVNLRREYVGTKNYDRWSGQLITCPYGYGPSHGSVCFSIRLTDEARKRDLTDKERDAAIYYLMNLPAIQDAREAV